jgi:hypothetical protein
MNHDAVASWSDVPAAQESRTLYRHDAVASWSDVPAAQESRTLYRFSVGAVKVRGVGARVHRRPEVVVDEDSLQEGSRNIGSSDVVCC